APAPPPTLLNRALAHVNQFVQLEIQAQFDTSLLPARDVALKEAKANIDLAVQAGPPSGDLYLVAARVYGRCHRPGLANGEHGLAHAGKGFAYGVDPTVFLEDGAFVELRNDPEMQKLTQRTLVPNERRFAVRLLDPLEGEVP